MEAALIMKIWYDFTFSWFERWFHPLQIRTFIANHSRLEFCHQRKKEILAIVDNILSLMAV
jgi:hypothetical protein